MKENVRVSKAVIKRMPRYRRFLRDLQQKGVEKISSEEFSRLIGCTASQIRQDFNNFGEFGQQGYGYNVSALHNEIGAILGLEREYKMVVAGAGNLGRAIINYTYYHRSGFKVVGIFEANQELIGTKINGIEIMYYRFLENFIVKNKVDIGIICTGRDSAQDLADRMVRAGINGIWNFAPLDMRVPEGVALENTNFSDSLHSLAYHINKCQAKE